MPRDATHPSGGKLDYIGSLLRELRELAESERYDMLAYLIHMAEVEAGDIAKGVRAGRIPPDAGKGTQERSG